MLVRTPF